MQIMQPKSLPLAPVENPLAPYSQSMHGRFSEMLAQSDVEAEIDVATTEQANLLRYCDSPARGPERPLRAKIKALLLQLKPVAHLFADAVREELLHQVYGPIKTPEQTLSPLNVLVKTIHESLPWASLEPRVLRPLERLRDYYETAYRDLTTGARQARVQWLTWKAQLSIPSVGHYLISVNAARQLVCRDELGKTVKRNNEGNHAVVFRDGLVFKPNPQIDDKADPIEPGMEHAVVAWHQLLANSANSAAPTEMIKLRQVPFKLETGATVLEGGVVQCGFMIRGVLLLDMLVLQETMQHWVNALGQPAVEALLPRILSGVKFIVSQGKAQVNNQAIEQILREFCAYSQSLPPEQGLSGIDELLNKPQLWFDAVEYIQRKGGLPTLDFVFAWCKRHPELMHGQSMGDVLGWLEGFKVLFKLSPDGCSLSAKDQIDISLNWAKRLNLDNVTAMALTSLLTYPTDGKGDNYMVTFRIDEATHLPHDFHIIGIDSDRALLSGDVPLEGITCRPGIGKNAPPMYWPDLNCVFLVLKDVLSLPVSQPIVNHLLSKTPLQWVEAWLTSILYKTQQWQEWQALKILVPEDIAVIKDDMKIKRLDIPVHLPTQLMDGLLSRLEKIQKLFQNLVVVPTLTVKEVFFALEPILAVYYETLMHQFPHQPLKAHERIHKPFDRKYGGQLEIKALLEQRLQMPVPPLAVLAAAPTSPASFSSPQANTTLETLLNCYQIQQKSVEQTRPIKQLADHLAVSPQGLFSHNDFSSETHIQTTLQRVEALGRLGAEQFKLSLGNISSAVLAQAIHQAIHFANPGALRLLLLKRERRLAKNAEPLRLREPEGLLQHLNDSEGRNLWHVLFSKLNAVSYAEHRETAEHITSLLAHVVPHQINMRDNEGHLAIFTLVRRIAIVPEQAELVLSRLVTLGLDFTLTEKSDKAGKPDETPLDHAMQMCLSRPEKPPLAAVTLLLRYGAGRAVSLTIAQAFFQQFKQAPGIEEALNQLRQQNRVFAWQLALNTLTDPLDIGKVPKGAWVIEGTKTGKRYLAPEIVVRVKQTQVEIPPSQAKQSGQIKQKTDSSADEQYGRHKVLPVNYRGEQMHLKILPELPGLEYAVGSLYRHFFNYGLPETELFRFPGLQKNQPLAVLFSQTIVGENLHDVLKSGNDNAAAKLSQLDIGRFTELFIMHLLTNPEDGKDDNYQLVSFINTQGQERYAIVPIDNDHAFVDAFRIETDETTGDPVRLLQIKTIIYCLDAMHWPLDTSVIQKFVNLSVAQKLTGWLTELTQTEQSFNQLFNNKKERQQLLKHTTHPVIIGVPFAPKKIAMLYDKARKLQKLFQKHLQTQINNPDKPMLSGLDVLKKLEPTLGHYYEAAFHEADTPQGRFLYLAKDLYAIDARGQQQTMLSGIVLLSTQNITEKDLLNQGERYSPKQALRELEQVQKEYTQLETVRRAVQGGNIKALDALLLDKNKQQVILGLNLTQLKPKDQEALWKYLTDKKTAIAFEKLRIQGTNDRPITALTDDLLKKLLSQSPYLRELHLAHCSNITEDSLSKLSDVCPSLMILRLIYLPTLTALSKKKKRAGGLRAAAEVTMPLDTLRALEIISCLELNTIDICAKLLSELLIANTPRLSTCKTQSEKLKNLTLHYSNLSAIQQWRGLIVEQACSTLNCMNIVGDVKEPQFYVGLMTAYPILLSVDWEHYKDSVLPDEIKKTLALFIDLKIIYPSLRIEQKNLFLNLVISMLEQKIVPSDIYLILKLFGQFKVHITTLNVEDQKTLFVSLITTLEKIWEFKKQIEEFKKQSGIVIQALLTALGDDKYTVRAAAASALVKLGHENPDIIQALLKALGKTKESDLRAAAALVKLGHENPDAIQTLQTALWDLKNSNVYIVFDPDAVLNELEQGSSKIIQALYKTFDERSRDEIDSLDQVNRYTDNYTVRVAVVAALGALGALGYSDVIQILLELLQPFANWHFQYDLFQNHKIRAAIASALGELKQANPDVIQALMAASKYNRENALNVRVAAAGALVKLGHETPDVIEILRSALRDVSESVRTAAANALGELAKSLQEQMSKSTDELEALLAKFEQIYLPATPKAIEVEEEAHAPFGKIYNEDATPSMARPALSLSVILTQPNGPGFFATDAGSMQQQADANIAKTEEGKDSLMLNQSH